MAQHCYLELQCKEKSKSVPTGNVLGCVLKQTGKWDNDHMQPENCDQGYELPAGNFHQKNSGAKEAVM